MDFRVAVQQTMRSKRDEKQVLIELATLTLRLPPEEPGHSVAMIEQYLVAGIPAIKYQRKPCKRAFFSDIFNLFEHDLQRDRI